MSGQLVKVSIGLVHRSCTRGNFVAVLRHATNNAVKRKLASTIAIHADLYIIKEKKSYRDKKKNENSLRCVTFGSTAKKKKQTKCEMMRATSRRAKKKTIDYVPKKNVWICIQVYAQYIFIYLLLRVSSCAWPFVRCFFFSIDSFSRVRYGAWTLVYSVFGGCNVLPTVWRKSKIKHKSDAALLFTSDTVIVKDIVLVFLSRTDSLWTVFLLFSFFVRGKCAMWPSKDSLRLWIWATSCGWCC